MPRRGGLDSELHHSRLLETAKLQRLTFSFAQHIGATLWDLGLDGTRDIAAWNILTWGNVGITAVLFTVRMMWFTGFARGSSVSAKPTSKTM